MNFEQFFSVTGLQLANKMSLVFSEYPNFLYFSWIILPPSATVFLLMGVWLWDLVVKSNLLQWVCKSEVLVLISSNLTEPRLCQPTRCYSQSFYLLHLNLLQYTCQQAKGREKIAQIGTPINCKSIYKFQSGLLEKYSDN